MPKSKINTDVILKVILIAWIAFTSLYFIYTEYGRLTNFVYNKGMTDAAVRVIEESQKCQPVPVNVGNISATLVNVACLTPPADSEPAQE